MTTNHIWRTLPLPTDRVNSFGATTNGKHLISTAKDGSIRLKDDNAGLQFTDLQFTDPVYNVIFSPDGKRLYVNSSGNEFKAFETE